MLLLLSNVNTGSTPSGWQWGGVSFIHTHPALHVKISLERWGLKNLLGEHIRGERTDYSRFFFPLLWKIILQTSLESLLCLLENLDFAFCYTGRWDPCCSAPTHAPFCPWIPVVGLVCLLIFLLSLSNRHSFTSHQQRQDKKKSMWILFPKLQ